MQYWEEKVGNMDADERPDENRTIGYPEPDFDRLLETFLTLVQIDSPSYQEADVIAWVSQALTDEGCQVRTDNSAELTGSNSGNLIAVLPAAGACAASAAGAAPAACAASAASAASAAPAASAASASAAPARIYFSAHADTMQPGSGIVPVINNGIITSASDTILGGDDKVGIAAIIETVRTLVKSGQPHPEIVILISVAEEVGLKGSKAMDATDIGFAGEPCFVLDAGGEPGGVIIGAPFHIEYNAVFTGKASHAGVSPESGISAIIMAANAISNLPLGRLDSMTTANVGTIVGGSANNVLAESCTFTGEIRSLSQTKVEEVRDQVKSVLEAAAADAGGTVNVEFNLAYHGFNLSEDDTLVQLVLNTARSLGLAAKASYTGGGSDANIFAGKGLNPVVLATGMTDVHSKDESLAVADLQNITRLLTAITCSF